MDELFAGEKAEHTKSAAADMANVIHARINGVEQERYNYSKLTRTARPLRELQAESSRAVSERNGMLRLAVRVSELAALWSSGCDADRIRGRPACVDRGWRRRR